MSNFTAFIYQITFKDSNDCYIGSTNNYQRRMSEHKSRYNDSNCSAYNRKLYTYIRNNGGWDNVHFNVLYKFESNDDEEIRIKERQFYDFFKPSLNTNKPYISEEEKKKKKANFYINKKRIKKIYKKLSNKQSPKNKKVKFQPLKFSGELNENNFNLDDI